MNSDYRRFSRRFESLASRYAMTLNLCEEVVQKHGIARNVRENVNGKNSFHDYMFLCFTKATKTLGSIFITVTAYRGEDSLILVRSVYESYVQMAFLLRNPSTINDFVAHKIGTFNGDVLTDHRKHRLLDAATRTEIGQMHSVGKMARTTWWPSDGPVHEFLYGYLCSYTHMDIQSLPYFLDGDKFTTKNQDRIHQAALYGTFYAVLLLDVMGLLTVHFKTDRKRVQRSLLTTKKMLRAILEEMQKEKVNHDIPLRFLERLRNVGDAWNAT